MTITVNYALKNERNEDISDLCETLQNISKNDSEIILLWMQYEKN